MDKKTTPPTAPPATAAMGSFCFFPSVFGAGVESSGVGAALTEETPKELKVEAGMFSTSCFMEAATLESAAWTLMMTMEELEGSSST